MDSPTVLVSQTVEDCMRRACLFGEDAVSGKSYDHRKFDTKISDSGLSDLSGMSDLQTIEIGKTLVTEKGVAQFKLSLPNCIVEHDVYPAT